MIRILMTDDDELLLSLYRSVMKSQSDVEVTYAHSEAESREKLDSDRYDLAFFDINLGQRGNEGIGLLDHVTAQAPGTIAIMMSTQDDDLTRQRCASAQDFVSKNATFIQALMVTLRAQLETVRARKVGAAA